MLVQYTVILRENEKCAAIKHNNAWNMVGIASNHVEPPASVPPSLSIMPTDVKIHTHATEVMNARTMCYAAGRGVTNVGDGVAAHHALIISHAAIVSDSHVYSRVFMSRESKQN